jgi:hypothetical protein
MISSCLVTKAINDKILTPIHPGFTVLVSGCISQSRKHHFVQCGFVTTIAIQPLCTTHSCPLCTTRSCLRGRRTGRLRGRGRGRGGRETRFVVVVVVVDFFTWQRRSKFQLCNSVNYRKATCDALAGSRASQVVERERLQCQHSLASAS